MNKILNYLISHLKIIIVVYVVIQIFVLFFLQQNYLSDSFYYYKLAEDCLTTMSLYPASIHLYEPYIVAPLYVNLILLILFIHNSILSIGLLNIILNLLQLYFLYKLAQTIFNDLTAKITAILYILYLNNLGMIILNLTELLFGVLILASIYFYIKRGAKHIILSGVLAGASLAVRPIGWALLFSIIILELFYWFKNKTKPKQLLPFLFGSILFISTFGLITYYHFDHFVFTSSTAGINLLIGANDDSNGGFIIEVVDKGKAGYLPNASKLTYIEKNIVWKNKAKEWIFKHKLKWMSLFPLKFLHLFIWDDISISNLLAMPDCNFARFVKYIVEGKNLSNLFQNHSKIKIIIYFIVQFIHIMFYYMLLFLIVRGSVVIVKRKLLKLNVFITFLFCLIGIGMTLIVYGSAIYKYPYIIILLPVASFSLSEIIKKNNISLNIENV